jgi:hypothetical protein
VTIFNRFSVVVLTWKSGYAENTWQGQNALAYSNVALMVPKHRRQDYLSKSQVKIESVPLQSNE